MKVYVGADASSAPRSEAPSGSGIQRNSAQAAAIALRATPDEASRATKELMWRTDE